MRRFLSMLLAFMMLFCLTAAAAEEPAADGGGYVWTFEPGYAEADRFLHICGGLIYTGQKGKYHLMTPEGVPVLDGRELADIHQEEHGYVRVTDADGNVGLLSPEGVLTVPMEYGKVYFLSERLTVGLRWREAAGDEPHDFDVSGTGYAVTGADVYVDGALLLTLGPDEFDPAKMSYSPGLEGRFLRIPNRAGRAVWYDMTGQKTGQVTYTGLEFEEDWDEDFHTCWFHAPTGVQAFIPGCPLTAEDTEISVLYDEETGCVLDLQGNVLFTVSEQVRAETDCSLHVERVTENCIWLVGTSRYMIFDRQGNCLADIHNEDWLSEMAADGPFCSLEESDGRIVLINADTGAVARFTLPEGYSVDTVGARYFIISDSWTRDMILITADDVIPLGCGFTNNCSRELLNVEIDGAHLLVDLKGNVILRDLFEIGTEDVFCIRETPDACCQVCYLFKQPLPPAEEDPASGA